MMRVCSVNEMFFPCRFKCSEPFLSKIRLKSKNYNTDNLTEDLSLFFFFFFVHTWSHSLRPSLMLMWQCHYLLFGLLTKGHIPECHVSHVCRLMIRMIMRWYRMLCRDLLVFTMKIRNPGKPQLGDRLMKTVRPVIFSKRGLYHWTTCQEGRRKERKGGVGAEFTWRSLTRRNIFKSNFQGGLVSFMIQQNFKS